MRLASLCLLLLLCSLSYGANTIVKLNFAGQHQMTHYPGAYESQLRRDSDGHFLEKTPEIAMLTAYYYVNIPKGARALKYAFTYQCSNNATPTLTTSFREKGGANASAGMSKHNFPVAETWQTNEILIDIPDGAEQIQCIHSANGNNFVLGMKSVTITFLPDKYNISPATADFSPQLPPKQWQDITELQGFYLCVTAEPATEQTNLKLTYDDKNLYVGYVAELADKEKLRATVKDDTLDARIFSDDCLELFLSAPDRELAWQFATNALGSRFDAEVRQNMPGDPWRVQSAWNGDWHVVNHLDDDSWQAAFIIPWATLGYSGIPTQPMGFNAGRENKSGAENSQWNAYNGNFHAVASYGALDFGANVIERSRQTDRTSYLIERATPQYEALLSDVPGNIEIATWGTAVLSAFPEKIQALYTAEEKLAWQEALMEARADAGMMGPALPWYNRLEGGWKAMHDYNKRYGTMYPYHLFNSAISRYAIEAGAKYYYGDHGVDPACEGYRNFVVNWQEKLKDKYYYQHYRDLVGLVFGIDEPTNQVLNIYSRSRNTKLAEALDDADQEIKTKTGFGKFGLFDAFAEPGEDIEWQKIAFWRWWNDGFAQYCHDVKEKINEVLPGVDFKSVNRNTVSGICWLDIALISPWSDWISCDPYPTSTSVLYRHSRALYHPGFSAKIVGDLAAKSRLCVTPQNFIYHGGRPEPDEIREWASQCLKVGAQKFFWYVENADTIMNMWEGNLEVLALNKQIKSLPKLKLPLATRSAVLYSDYDRWGLDDKAAHASYSVYTLLGEQAQAWFRFVSPTGMNTGLHELSQYQVLYIPRMKFTDPATTAKIISFIQNGGTLVCFDPDMFATNIDGTTVAERGIILPTTLTAKDITTPALKYGQHSMPIYKITHLSSVWSNKYQAFDFGQLPAGSKVLATYADDDKPAIIEHQVGKGKVIFSAVQPFGNSDVALMPTGWTEFVRDRCQEVDEPVGLPIWDFVLKRFPENEVKLNLDRKW